MELSNNDEPANISDENRRKVMAEKLEAKKELLKKEIRELEELNFQIECSLNISKFGDIKHLLKVPQPAAPAKPLEKIPDVEAEIVDEWHQFSGMHMTTFQEDEYVFNFPTRDKNSARDSYAVQIKMDSEKPKIGKWIMPESSDIKKIEIETPLHCPMDLKPFLANCKHHIACYGNRVEQYKNLQKVVSELSGCWLDSIPGYTVITLKLLDLEETQSGKLYNIVVYLIYDARDVRPLKIKIEQLNSKELDDDMRKLLRKYFKDFKSFDLKTAFEKTVSAQESRIVWRQGKVADVMDLNNSSVSSSEEDYLTNRKKKKTRGKKRKAAETSMQSQGSPSQNQNADSSDSEEALASRLNLSSSITKRRKKSTQDKQKVSEEKTKKIEKAKATPRASKKKTTSGVSPKKNVVASNANTSKKNLRQSKLGFETQAPKDVEPTATTDRDVPIAEKSSAVTNMSISKKKSKSIATTLAKSIIGTSTPVPHLSKSKKRFATDDGVEVSPIKRVSKTPARKKTIAKKPA